MRNVLRWPAAAIVGFCLLAGPLVPAAASTVPSGTEVPMEFVDGLNSKTARKGDTVTLRVTQDVTVDGRVVVPAGARAEGVVEKVHRGRTFGRRGEIKMRLVRVLDTAGNPVPLESYKTGNRVSSKGPGAAGAGLLVLGPLGLAAGAFVKGGDVTIKPGTQIQGVVAGAN